MMNTTPGFSVDFHAKPLETLIQELPTDLRVEVRNFVEFLLLKRAQTVKPAALPQERTTSPLHGTVLRYDDPYAPVAEAEWETAQNAVTEASNAHTAERGADAWHFLTARAGSLTAPEDWATEHDHYLYGIAKQQERDDVP